MTLKDNFVKDPFLVWKITTALLLLGLMVMGAFLMTDFYDTVKVANACEEHYTAQLKGCAVICGDEHLKGLGNNASIPSWIKKYTG